jgi:hypothetical protein
VSSTASLCVRINVEAINSGELAPVVFVHPSRGPYSGAAHWRLVLPPTPKDASRSCSFGCGAERASELCRPFDD